MFGRVSGLPSKEILPGSRNGVLGKIIFGEWLKPDHLDPAIVYILIVWVVEMLLTLSTWMTRMSRILGISVL